MIHNIQDFLFLTFEKLNTQVSHLNTFHTDYKHGLKNFHNNSGCQNLLVQTQPQDFIKLHNNSGCQNLLVQTQPQEFIKLLHKASDTFLGATAL